MNLLEWHHSSDGASKCPLRNPGRQFPPPAVPAFFPMSDNLDWLPFSWSAETLHFHGGVDIPIDCQHGGYSKLSPFCHDGMPLRWWLLPYQSFW